MDKCSICNIYWGTNLIKHTMTKYIYSNHVDGSLYCANKVSNCRCPLCGDNDYLVAIANTPRSLLSILKSNKEFDFDEEYLNKFINSIKWEENTNE